MTKPTKEQLADPKWWDRNTESTDNYILWSKERLSFISLENYINDIDGYELLAKRPEAKWVPKVGEWCEAWLDGEFRKAQALKFHDRTDAIAFDFVDCLKWSSDYRPIKTQREEFIERVVYETLNMCSEQLRERIANELYDAGCRFELTKKDGE